MSEKNWKKLVTERPRRGGTRAEASRADRNFDSWRLSRGGYDALPKHAPLLEHSHFGADCYRYEKSFDDNLAPLRRWLRSQTGRPWNKVYSAMCSMVDRSSTTGAHVFDHLRSWVHTSVVVYDDGEVWSHGRSGPRPLASRYYTEFYVHPKTGLLHEQPRVRRKPKPPAPLTKVKDTAGRDYEKIDGIWYEVWYVREEVTVWDRWTRDRFVMRVVKKRQLPKKELRALGLVNG